MRQGDATISSADYERRAVAAETSIFFDAKSDDPVVAYAEAVKGRQGDCDILRAEMPVGAPTPPDTAAAASSSTDGAEVPDTAPAEVTEAAKGRARSCRKGVIDGMRWNRSQFSISYGTGWIKGKADGSRQEELGRSLVASLNYGFDGVGVLHRNALLAVTYRRAEDEPVLNTLQNAAVQTTDSSVVTYRLAYGSRKIRGLAEMSDSKSRDVTASRRTFKQAIGLDLRIFEATWVNFRFGKQRKIDGTDDEYGSLFSLSYSPTALLSDPGK